MNINETPLTLSQTPCRYALTIFYRRHTYNNTKKEKKEKEENQNIKKIIQPNKVRHKLMRDQQMSLTFNVSIEKYLHFISFFSFFTFCYVFENVTIMWISVEFILIVYDLVLCFLCYVCSHIFVWVTYIWNQSINITIRMYFVQQIHPATSIQIFVLIERMGKQSEFAIEFCVFFFWFLVDKWASNFNKFIFIFVPNMIIFNFDCVYLTITPYNIHYDYTQPIVE